MYNQALNYYYRILPSRSTKYLQLPFSKNRLLGKHDCKQCSVAAASTQICFEKLFLF